MHNGSLEQCSSPRPGGRHIGLIHIPALITFMVQGKVFWEANTLYLGAAVVGGAANVTATAAACSARCDKELLLCQIWSW